MKKISLIIVTLFIFFMLIGCSITPKKPYNYKPFLQKMPTSILVLPPINHSLEVNAPYMYISTVTRPIAEKGYYVYPVAVIDALMRENGVTTPENMHQIPLKKLKEIIDPDAVLYLTIKEWGTQYKLIDSQTIINISAKLVDTESGTTIWQSTKRMVKSSSENRNGIAEMLVAALINQVMSNFLDPSIDVARILNKNMYYNSYNGLLVGKLHPLHEEKIKEINEQNE